MATRYLSSEQLEDMELRGYVCIEQPDGSFTFNKRAQDDWQDDYRDRGPRCPSCGCEFESHGELAQHTREVHGYDY